MTRSMLRSAQPPFARSWRGLAAGSLSALSGVALLATSAYLITRAAEQPPVLYLSIAIVSVRLFALARAVFRYLDRLASHDAAFRQLAVVRTDLYRRLVRVAPAGLGRTSRGDLLSRLVSDVDALQDLPLRVVQPLAVSAVSALASVIGVSVISPVAGFTLLAVLVVTFAIGCLLADRLARTTEHSLAERRGRLGGAVLDTIQNLDVLVAFDALPGRLDAVRRLDCDLVTAALRRAWTSGLVAALISLFSGGAVLLITAVAAPGIGDGLTGPEYALVALVPLAVFEVVGAVPVAVIAWRRVRASADRVEAAAPQVVPREIVVDSDADGDDDAANGEVQPRATLQPGAAVLQLTGLGARWPGATGQALEDVTLSVRMGERILIDGPSGAGKSTLASALVRFLEYSGSYEVAGVDTRQMPAERVRATVGLIEQTPYLFDDSVRQNLLFARDTATDDELTAVLERVGLAEWLRERGGLYSGVGERGALLSGGQAQRLSVARALLREFPVLVLDEPAAGVDPERADGLLDDLLGAAERDGTTVLLISHVPVRSDRLTRRISMARGRIARDSIIVSAPEGAASREGSGKPVEAGTPLAEAAGLFGEIRAARP